MMRNYFFLKLAAVIFMLVSASSCSTKCDCEPYPDNNVISHWDLMKNLIQVNTSNFATGFESYFKNIDTKKAVSDSAFNAEFCQTIISPLSFFEDESGYFFVETNNAWMVAHGTKPKLIGTYRYDVQDINGKFYVHNMVETIKYKGYGFVDYYFTHPQTGVATRKLAFVQSIPTAGFFIGSGFYTTDQSNYYTREESAKAVLETATKSMAQGLVNGFKLFDDSLAKADFCRLFVDNIRFFDNQSGYFFIYDLKGVNVALGPQKDLEGQNLYDFQDSRGNYVIRDLIKIVTTEGSGYYKYYWNNPATGTEESKTSFVYRMPGTDYFIGSGFYLQD